jgi:hypothetical protein
MTTAGLNGAPGASPRAAAPGASSRAAAPMSGRRW